MLPYFFDTRCDTYASSGLDEAKVQEIMKQMREVERQKEELEEQKRKHAEHVKAQAEAAAAHREATAGGGMGMAMPGGDGSGYVDWLKKKMMRAQTGMNEDELDWEFKVDNKQVGNSFLHAEAEEKLAQQEYGQLMSEKDAFDR